MKCFPVDKKCMHLRISIIIYIPNHFNVPINHKKLQNKIGTRKYIYFLIMEAKKLRIKKSPHHWANNLFITLLVQGRMDWGPEIAR